MSTGGVSVLRARSPPGCFRVTPFSADHGDGGQPTCPICLTDVVELHEKAVINPCMHVYHIHCLDQWLEHKKLCPLCKAKVTSYFHRISKSGGYSERVLPSTPPRGPERDSSILPLIDQARLSSSHTASSRHDFWSHPVHSRSAHFRARGSDHRSNHRRAAGRGPAQPRPYFHRVRAMLSAPDGRIAGAAAPGSGARLPDLRSATEERSLSWRRHVYSHGLRAVPMEPSHGQNAGQAPSRQRRIEEWVTRELRALLHSDDVLLLRSFVMGLAASPHALQQEEGPQQALRPFLHDHARHFWHELRCFARVPFSMSTYDRLVEYRPPGAPQEGAAPQAPEADGSWTLWRARHSAGIDNGDPAGPWHSGRAHSSSSGALQSCGHMGLEEGLRCTGSRCSSRGMCVAAGGQGDTGLCLDCAERAAERCTTGGGSRWGGAHLGRPADPEALASRADMSGRQDEGYSRPQQAEQLAPEIIDIADSPARPTAGTDIVIDLSSDSEEELSGACSGAQRSGTEHQAALLSTPSESCVQEAPRIQPEPPAPRRESIAAAVMPGGQAADGNNGGSTPVRVSFALPVPRTRHAARDRGLPFGMHQATDGARTASRPVAVEPDGARPDTQARDSASQPSSEPSATVGTVPDMAGREAHGKGAARDDSCKEDGGGGQRHRHLHKRSRSRSRSRRWASSLKGRERHSRAYRDVDRLQQEGAELSHMDQQPECAEGKGCRPACETRWEMWKPGDDVA